MPKYTEEQKTWAINLALDRRQHMECPFELANRLLDFIYPTGDADTNAYADFIARRKGKKSTSAYATQSSKASRKRQ